MSLPPASSPPTSDGEQARGDALASSTWFSEEIHAHEPALRAHLRRRYPWLTDLDDLVQETYARLLRPRDRGGVRSSKSFLFATARNLACDWFRRRRVVPMENVAQIDASVADDGPSVSETVCHAQEIELVLEAVRELPARCREVLTLRKIYGLSHKEIAARLDISERTVNAQIAIGLLRCREFLQARGVHGCERP